MQVWLMILVSVMTTVGTLTFLSWYYNHNYVKDSNPSMKVRRKLAFDYFSFNMIYVLNIMTNQGNQLLISLL